MKNPVEYEAAYLRDNVYAVKPKGQLGTCGWYPSAWMVTYVRARSPEVALVVAANKRAAH